MLSPEEKKYISDRAYVPEHILNLMIPISKGEPSLIRDYIYFSKDNWIIFIGYPLSRDFVPEDLKKTIDSVIKKRQPEYVWLIAPEIPDSLAPSCRGRGSDQYYKLELSGLKPKKDLIRLVRRASKDLIIEKGRSISKEHTELISEFMKKEKPNPLIREHFLSMQEYVRQSETAAVLNALDKKDRLSAFYVVELGAADFATYVVGCYSRKNYVPNASDLLFSEMITLAQNDGKGYINLGLGVNEGIRRFKKKWGGIPFLRYEFCEFRPSGGHTDIFQMIKRLGPKL